MDEDFEALYGTASEPVAAPQTSAVQQDAPQPKTAPAAAPAEPDDLFAQLYGAGLPEEDVTGAPMPSGSPDGRPALGWASLAGHHLATTSPRPALLCRRSRCVCAATAGSSARRTASGSSAEWRRAAWGASGGSSSSRRGG